MMRVKTTPRVNRPLPDGIVVTLLWTSSTLGTRREKRRNSRWCGPFCGPWVGLSRRWASIACARVRGQVDIDRVS
jgi:hypothetical protein